MTSKRSQPELKPKPLDALVVLAVLLLGVAAAWLAYGGENSGALTATVKHRGQVVARVELSSLTEEKTVSIDGTYHLTVTLDRTGAAVTDSDCPPGVLPGRARVLCACRSRSSSPWRGRPPRRMWCWDRGAER